MVPKSLIMRLRLHWNATAMTIGRPYVTPLAEVVAVAVVIKVQGSRFIYFPKYKKIHYHSRAISLSKDILRTR